MFFRVLLRIKYLWNLLPFLYDDDVEHVVILY